MNNNWKQVLILGYRRKFGCMNDSSVCWCDVCINIDRLINEVIKNIRDQIQ